MPDRADKTFYLETFGCQMNVHDSEKVIGTLISEGYRQVADRRGSRAGPLQHLHHPRQGRAEGLPPPGRLQEVQKQGKIFGVLGCVAQQEGEKIFERAPHVSLVCGSASYRKLPQMLVQLEAGNRRVTGLETDRPTSASRPNSPPATIRTAATSPSSKAATSPAPTAWCRSPAARSAAGPPDSVLAEARRMADLGYTEIQLLGQNVNCYRDPAGKKTFAELLAAVGEVPGIRRVRFTTSHPRDFGKDIVDAIDADPTLCDHVHLPVQSGSTRVLDAMQRLYTPRAVPGAHRLDESGASARLASPPTSSSAFPARPRRTSNRRLSCSIRSSTTRLQLQVLAATEHARAAAWTTRSPMRKKPAAWRSCRRNSAKSRSAAINDISGRLLK